MLAEIPGAKRDAVQTLRMAAAVGREDERCDLLLAALLTGTDDEAAERHVERGRAGWAGGGANFDVAFDRARAQVARSRSGKGPEGKTQG